MNSELKFPGGVRNAPVHDVGISVGIMSNGFLSLNLGGRRIGREDIRPFNFSSLNPKGEYLIIDRSYPFSENELVKDESLNIVDFFNNESKDEGAVEIYNSESYVINSSLHEPNSTEWRTIVQIGRISASSLIKKRKTSFITS